MFRTDLYMGYTFLGVRKDQDGNEYLYLFCGIKNLNNQFLFRFLKTDYY